jgi:hypothetical protein
MAGLKPTGPNSIGTIHPYTQQTLREGLECAQHNENKGQERSEISSRETYPENQG